MDVSEGVTSLREMSDHSYMILVVGAVYQDSGKTTLASALVKRAREKDLDVGICKPVTTFNGWFQHEAVMESQRCRKLVGRDLIRLHRAALSKNRIEIEGPLVSMIMPIDPEYLEWRMNSPVAMDLIERLILMRVSDLEMTEHYLISENLRRLPPSLQRMVTELARSLEPPPQEITAEEAHGVLTKSSDRIDRCLNHLKSRHGLTVVESYSDIAVPAPSALEASTVVVVAPGRAAIVDGGRFRTALNACSTVSIATQLTVGSIMDLIRAEYSYSLIPGKFETEFLDSILDRELRPDGGVRYP